MKKPIMGNTVGTPYKSVPRMSVLDKKANIKEDWFAEPQKEFPRVYAESSESQDLYNKLFLTQDAVAPVDPNGQAAVFGKGLYFTSAAESERWSNLSDLSKIKTNSSDSSYVSIKSDGTWCVCSTNVDTVDREIWMMPTGWSIFNSSKRKAVVEFDIKFDEFTVLSDSNVDFTFKISPMFYKTYSTGTRAITTGSSTESALLLFVTENSIRVKANGIEEKEYSINPKTMFNFKLALCGSKYSLYINDYLMVTGNTIADTRECYSLNRMGIILNKKASTKFSMNNLFCGVVDGDELYSGRYLDSVAGRRKNKHILVPGKLSDYKDDESENISAEEYALSYGAAKEWLEKQDINITKSVPKINLNNTNSATGNVTEKVSIYVGATGAYFGVEKPENSNSHSTKIRMRMYEDKSKINQALELQFNGEPFGIYGDHYLPAATSSKMGGIKSGGDITVNSDGTVKVNTVPETSGNDITIEKVTPKVILKNKSAVSTTPGNLGVIGTDTTGTYISANNPSTGAEVTKVSFNTSDNPAEAIMLKHKTERYMLYGQHHEPVASTMSLGFVRAGDDISVNAAGNVTVTHATEATTATKADSVNATVFAGHGYKVSEGDEFELGTLGNGYYLLMFNFEMGSKKYPRTALYDASSATNGYLRIDAPGMSGANATFYYWVDNNTKKLYLKLHEVSATANDITFHRTFAIKLNF